MEWLYGIGGLFIGMLVMGLIWAGCKSTNTCFHNMLECGHARFGETWHRTLQGHKIPGTEYERVKHVRLKQCSHFYQLAADTWYTSEGCHGEIDPQLAIKLIKENNGDLVINQKPPEPAKEAA